MRRPHRSNLSGVLVRVRRLVLTTALLAAAPVLSPAGVPSAAAADEPPAIPVVTGMVADDARGRVFVTRPAAPLQVWSTAGVQQGEVAALAGAQGLARAADDGLWTALPDEGSVARLDPATLAVQEWSLGEGSCPAQAAPSTVGVWVVDDCQDGDPGLVLLDPEDGSLTPLPEVLPAPQAPEDPQQPVPTTSWRIAVDPTAPTRVVALELARPQRLLDLRLDVDASSAEVVGQRSLVPPGVYGGSYVRHLTVGVDRRVLLDDGWRSDPGTVESGAYLPYSSAVGPAMATASRADAALAVVSLRAWYFLDGAGQRAEATGPVTPAGTVFVRNAVAWGGGAWHAFSRDRENGLHLTSFAPKRRAEVELSLRGRPPFGNKQSPYNYGETIELRVGLDTTAAQRTVSVYATANGRRQLIGQVRPAQRRPAVLRYRMLAPTTVEAVYAGDASTRSATARQQAEVEPVGTLKGVGFIRRHRTGEVFFRADQLARFASVLKPALPKYRTVFEVRDRSTLVASTDLLRTDRYGRNRIRYAMPGPLAVGVTFTLRMSWVQQGNGKRHVVAEQPFRFVRG
ncbi:hypothetical protein [Nocardioides nanhaiensis]|uniref:Uncharacterized protein n=1 Tax=Nocardioides nanhaiensis TaxID=1476871 RepID=A0ABP8W2L5_9ACTN